MQNHSSGEFGQGRKKIEDTALIVMQSLVHSFE